MLGRRVLPWPLLVVALCLLGTLASAMKVHVQLEECATITATQPDVFWSSVVALRDVDGNDIRLDLSLKSESGEKLYEQTAVKEDTFKIYIHNPGSYRFCMLINPGHQAPGAGTATDVWWDWHFGDHHLHDAPHRTDTVGLSVQLTDLASQLDRLQAEVRYLHAREQRHRQTVESTHGRVWKYALVRGAALLGVAGFQVFCVRKMFSASLPQ